MSNLSKKKARILHCKKMIEGHLEFDRETNGRYHEYFDYAVLNKEVEILILENRYSRIFHPKYRAVRKKMSIKRKILVEVGCIFPRIADLMERKKNGWTK